MRKFIALLLILGLLSGCTAPTLPEETTAVTEATEESTAGTEPADGASDPLEGPEGLPTPAL